MPNQFPKIPLLATVLLLAVLAACSRTRYRLAADRDAYSLLRQKAAQQPWSPPDDLSVVPESISRLYDPSPLDDPWLPSPSPQLYSYQIPELPPPNASSQRRSGLPAPANPGAAHVPPVHISEQRPVLRLPPTDGRVPPHVQAADYREAVASLGLQPLPVVPASRWVQDQPPAVLAPPGQPDNLRDRDREYVDELAGTAADIELVPIPVDAWETVPARCRTRMLEFTKLREEYQRSFQKEPTPDQFAPGQRLTLENIVYLALLNSREYQTQKEVLYRTALRLSLERFAYQLKFSPFSQRTAANWNHTRSAGTTVNGLSVPTTLQVDKMLATGGDLVARFANDVVLTFNGPSGFAADVGSDLFFQFDQALLQVDVRFENLTQAERDVVYAARDFTRFRKLLFTQLASQYYNLIRTYRQVEIDSQNYFTLVRAFQQSQAEYRTSFLPRFQLDQVEQNVLAGRSRLISTCNNLESALDSLKIRIGLPTETYVNIDLTELEQLTTRDELSVTGELIRRVSRRLQEERLTDSPSRVVLLSGSAVLTERMLEGVQLLEGIGVATPEFSDLPSRLSQLQVEASRENSDMTRLELQEELQNQPPSLPIVFQRTLNLVDVQLELIEHQLNLLQQVHPDHPQSREYRQRVVDIRTQAETLRDELRKLVDAGQLGDLPQLVTRAEMLRALADVTVAELDRLTGRPEQRPTAEEEAKQALADVDELLTRSDTMLKNLGSGLTPIEIDVDDAMLTALNLRFDLMNQRGDVADNWRQIKYAGDDLKSILNISASHRLSTRSDVNRVFDFTFDESDTRVRATLDAPFNRFAQRNSYRQSLINYQASLRQLMQLEDSIKLAVRNDLRGLSLDQEQYVIDVASAALAYERVVSVLLELRLGIGRVAARDFLEAQNAYAASLSSVANRHIGYILDRMQLFLDLELLTVDDDGFWRELYDEQYQPEPYYQLPPYSTPAYGELVPGLWYSRSMRRMEAVPTGESAIHRPSDAPHPAEEVPTAPPLPPPAVQMD